MPARRSAPSTTPLPEPARPATKEPTRDDLLTALAERERELAEAVERQTATAEILRVISQSPTDTQPVFERVVSTAARALRCDLAAALVRDGDTFSAAASANAQGLLADFVPALQVPIDPNANFPSRAFVGKAMLHLPDWSLIDLPPHERAVQDLIGAQSAIYLPLMREDECIGVLALVGTRANSFGPKEIAQAEAFRDQALIAIENARLYRETREALEQQKASADVLSAISKSVADAAPVFEEILAACQRLFGGEEIGVYTIGDDGMVRATAWRGPRAEEALRDVTPLAESVTGRVIRERRTHHIPDLGALPDLSPTLRERVDRHGGASLLYAPMLWENDGLGSILVVRWPPRPFSEREQALLQSFADQAAVAIQNARLFNETREALERQTATANVLKVISRSVSDAAPVFETILESCQRLFGLEAVAVYLVEGDRVRGVARRGWERGDWGQDSMPLAGSSTGEAIAARRAVHVPDLAEKPGLPERFVAPLRESGGLTVLYAPMLSEDFGVGSIVVSRKPAKPFSEKEIALVQSFADQAAIAIQNARLFNETREALERQTATADILRVISQSPTDAQPVFDSIVFTAARSLRCDVAFVLLREGDAFMQTAGATPQGPMRDLQTDRVPIDPNANFPSRAILAKEMLSLPDWSQIDLPEHERNIRAAFGVNSALYLPLLREGECIGLLALVGNRPNNFGPKEIAQAESFRDQAMIAIQNARLFEAVQAKTRDLEEALQQQTATAEVLKVISRSAFDLDVAASAILEAAARLCHAPLATLHLRDGDVCRLATQFGLPEAFERAARETPIPVKYPLHSRRTARAGEVAHFSDAWTDPDYLYKSSARLGGYRAIVVVPLMRDGELVGIFSLGRPEPDPFTESQIKLTQTFADQAAIAIENARLFGEVQAKTRDLEESLAQQTATADVLKVISRSAFDLQAVLDTLTASATKLCDGDRAAIFQRRGDLYHFVSNYGFSDEMETFARANPLPVGSSGGITRAGRDRKAIHIPDVLADPEYTQRGYQSRGDYRTLLSTPLMREGEPIGGFVITRKAVRPFNDRQIELLQTFADQAVIAIENVRLFDEVQARTHDLTEALQQQTATAEVLQTISRSVFDLDTVLRTLIDTAVRLCRGSRGTIFIRNGDRIEGRAFHSNVPPGLRDYILANPAPIDRNEAMATAIREGRVLHYPDLASDPTLVPAGAREQAAFGALLCVPLMRNGEAIGCFAVPRDQPAAFSVGEIKLVETFADQAVIAIENARLFEQVQARTHELTQSLEDLRKAQDRLIQSEKLASLGQLTAGIAHEIKNPLNFINNFSALSRELMDELREVLEKAPLDGADREEAGDLIGMIDANLDKVVSHGKRADSIVKNMLLHSREGSGERASVNVNAMVEEALNLAYHGARAERPGFNVTIAKMLDDNAGAADLYAQEMTRVLLNLISNGFYATEKRKQANTNDDYEPTITASTRDLGHSVEVVIRDNGTGIPDEVKEKMFNPFFTTKPAGEGTGLGLSLSHDIVVKQHGGTIEATTEAGAFTQFTIVIPRTGATT